MNTDSDKQFMLKAITAGKKGLGWASPNPAVGAVIVKGDKIVSEGFTQPFGKAHAEAFAIEKASGSASGATLYVTLMPCAHHGKTPPCTEAIIKSGIKKVFVAVDDPNPTSLNGKEILEKAGVEVITGLCEGEVKEGLAAFFKYIKTGLPLVRLKYAMTLDGKIATRTGSSSWISNEESRADVQLLRSQSDAIMVGSGTVLSDNPRLNVRDKSKWQPKRIIIDSECKTPLESKIFTEPGGEVLIVTTEHAEKDKIQKLEAKGAKILPCGACENKKVDLQAALSLLAKKGITSILCESGGTLSGALFDKGLIDEVICYICPKICGGKEAHTPVAGSGLEDMESALNLTNIRQEMFDSDIKITGRLGNWDWL